eukprot:4371348-Amphidinium_carterae.1
MAMAQRQREPDEVVLCSGLGKRKLVGVPRFSESLLKSQLPVLIENALLYELFSFPTELGYA